MIRPTVIVLALAPLLGCHAPMPKFQPFAGSGTPRVAPPSTGSYGKPDAYYPGGSQSSLLAPETDVAVDTATAADANNPANMSAWQIAGSRVTSSQAIGTGVVASTIAESSQASARITRDELKSPDARQVDYEQPTLINNQRAIRIQAPAKTGSAPPLINSMPINDATTAAPPQRFAPTGQVIDISQLPRQATPVNTNGIRGFSAPAGAAATVSIATSAAPTASTNTSSGGWHSKYTPVGVGTR